MKITSKRGRKMILTKNVHILKDTENTIEFIMKPSEAVFFLDMKEILHDQPLILGKVQHEDQFLIKKEYLETALLIYIKDNTLFASIISRDFNFSPEKNSFAFKYESYMKEVTLKQTSDTAVSLFTATGELLFTMDDILAYESPRYEIPVDLKLKSTENRYMLAGKVEYDQFLTFLVYDLFKKEVIIRSMRFNLLSNKAGLQIEMVSPETIEISYKEDNVAVDLRKLTGKARKIFDFYQLEEHRDKHLLTSFTFNEIKYFIYNRQNGVFITKGKAMKITGYESRLKAFFVKDHLYIYGRNTHYAYKANGDYDYLYMDGNEEPLTKFYRPLKSRFLRRFGFFKIPTSSIISNDDLNHGLYLGDNQTALHPLKVDMKQKRGRIVTLKRTRDKALLLNASKRGSLFVHTSNSPEKFTLKQRIQTRISELKKGQRALQLFKFLFVVIGRLPKKQNLVIFESFHAKQYSDSPRAIYEYMKEYHSDYRLLWSVDRQAENMFKEFGVPYIRRFTIRWFLTFPRAKYWVNNVRLPGWMPKPEDTVYVQTWHGTPLKKLGIDIDEIHMPGTSTSTYKRNFITEARKWDYLVSPNAYSTEIFRRAFHYPGKIIESGYPRNDILTNHSAALAETIKEKLGIPAEKKVMLYAPTWRDDEFYAKGKYRFEFQFDLDNWKKEFGEDWVLLSRMHYLVAENFDFSAHEGTVYDASAYPDIRDLYLISDLLITDYSSVFFDFAILDRPIIFFMYDLETYRDQLRGFYIDIEEAPGPIVETQEELFKAINELKDSDVRMNPKFSVFKNKFSSLEDGDATKRVVKAFLE